MKISYNWLKDYLKVDLPAKEVSEILTDIGLEVEALEESNLEQLKDLVVGKVLEVSKHPDADKLKMTKVSIGAEELQIVCGAPNVETGQKVVVATIGTTLHPSAGEPFKIKKARIRGHVSEGMICAEDEIGLSDKHDGIMVLPAKAKEGKPLTDYLQLSSDSIFDIGLTPNRSDAMSHYGTARDLHAALLVKGQDYKLELPSVDDFKVDNRDLSIAVSVEDNKACPRYSGVSISGVKVGESPAWLKEKLNSIGQRPINNIVDVSNFVLHEIGQPLHAFDAAQIYDNQIVVKTLKTGTKFVTLDKESRMLHKEDLMICNGSEGMCIAGVFGGAKSGVTEKTTDIFLESAYFDPRSIRRTSSRHGIRSDAVIHFEKGTDPNITVFALKRAAMLIKEICGASISSEIVDIYPKLIEANDVELKYAHLDRLVGIQLDHQKVRQILTSLGIEIVSDTKDSLKLKIPTYKPDVLREADVIEEILRMYGYNNVPFTNQLHASLQYRVKPDTGQLQQGIAEYLAANGFYEGMATSITNSAYYDKIMPSKRETLVPLVNYTAEGMDVLRPTMLFGGLEAILHNQNRQHDDVKLFEFGSIYELKGKERKEQRQLALYISGNKYSESWTTQSTAVDLYHLKGFVHNILLKAGVKIPAPETVQTEIFPDGVAYSHPKAGRLVEFGAVSTAILSQMDVKPPVYCAMFNWDSVAQLFDTEGLKSRELSKFPTVRRDLSLLVPVGIQFQQIEQIAWETEKKLLKSVNLFDIYEDKKLGTGKKSYAVSYLFQDEQKTLTDQEVDRIMSTLMDRYHKQLKAEVRK